MAAFAGGQQELPARAQAVLNFWFGDGWEAAPPDDTRPQCKQAWYMSTPELDADIARRFGPDCEALLAGRLDSWRGTPLGALAGILLGDQIMRNAYRGTAKMYAADGRVLGWAKELLASGAVQQLEPIQQVFVLMTLMHSETLADQNECVARFEQLAKDCEQQGLGSMAAMARDGVKYAEAHRQVVAQWGRFPHRNAILGRTSTPEEAAGIAAGTIPKW
ncbi:hypothetical protein ABPG77_006427 [Micractinium sp. CCAP 211/92]